MEPTIIIALITALAAIISPVVTAKINNDNNLKIKEIESREERIRSVNLHEREVLEDALSGLGVLMGWKDAESIKESCGKVLRAVAYVDTLTGEKLIGITNSVLDRQKKPEFADYADVCDELRKEIAKRVE